MEYSDRENAKDLSRFEKEIIKKFKICIKENKQKALDFFEQYEEVYDEEYEKFKKGIYTALGFAVWYQMLFKNNPEWENLLKEMATSLTLASLWVSENTKKRLQKVASLSANYEAYKVCTLDINYSFSFHKEFRIGNNYTINELLKDSKIKLPAPTINYAKALKWNEEKLQKALIANIMQGKDIRSLADSFQMVANMDRNSALRMARTSYVGAQNAGKQAQMEEAERMGIDVQKEWVATLDERTRDSHGELDGIIIPVKERFPNGLRFPGDTDGRPEEVYNCRCTINYVPVKYRTARQRMTYKEWKKAQDAQEVQV